MSILITLLTGIVTTALIVFVAYAFKEAPAFANRISLKIVKYLNKR